MYVHAANREIVPELQYQLQFARLLGYRSEYHSDRKSENFMKLKQVPLIVEGLLFTRRMHDVKHSE